jgi:hypothetical protein
MDLETSWDLIKRAVPPAPPERFACPGRREDEWPGLFTAKKRSESILGAAPGEDERKLVRRIFQGLNDVAKRCIHG